MIGYPGYNSDCNDSQLRVPCLNELLLSLHTNTRILQQGVEQDDTHNTAFISEQTSYISPAFNHVK